MIWINALAYTTAASAAPPTAPASTADTALPSSHARLGEVARRTCASPVVVVAAVTMELAARTTMVLVVKIEPFLSRSLVETRGEGGGLFSNTCFDFPRPSSLG